MATTIRNGNLFCLNCGEEHKLNLPIPVNELVRRGRAFNSLHKNCNLTWKQPEVDQTKNITEKMEFWIEHGEQGTSSKTIFMILSGINPRFGGNFRCDHPHDPDDFRRCYLLLKTIPEWKLRLFELKEISLVWSNLVDNWDKLTEMLEEQMKTHKANGMYEFMKSLGC